MVEGGRLKKHLLTGQMGSIISITLNQMIVFEGIPTLKTDIKIFIFSPDFFAGSNDVHNKLPKIK